MGFHAIGPDAMRLCGALLIGSVPVANIICWATTGQDLRRVGTGTVSSSGLYQVGGAGPFMAACLLDIGKGAIVAELVRCRPPAVVAAAAGLAVAGHNWSLFQAGAGGRGVLPSTGVLLVTAPPGAALVTGAIAAGYVAGDTAPACFAAQLLLVPVLAACRGGGGAALGLAMVAPMLLKRLIGNKPLMPMPLRRNYITRLVYDRDVRLRTEEEGRGPVTGLISLGKGKEPVSRAVPASSADATVAADASVQERSPRVVLIVTGMGMRGDLEDDLRFRIERMFAPPVPVLVHRYGVARSGSLFRPCQRAATRRLAARLRDLQEAETDGQQSRPPDIVAHSFGSWLVGQALRHNPDLRVGRIIVAGSVLRPDFDWYTIIGNGQAEAVLNHYGSHDLWAFVSEFFIPDSGPAGFRGFADCPGVFNRREPRFRHLTFFQDRHINTVHRTLWRPFLTSPAGDLAGLVGPESPRSWRPRPWLLRANLLRALLLAGLAAGFGELLLSIVRLMAWLLS